MTPTADAHLHIFSRGFAGPLGSSAVGDDELAAYERLRSHHGIERGLVIGYEREPRYVGNNEEVLTLAQTRQWAVPLAYVPLEPAPTVVQLRKLRSRGATGVAMFLPDAPAGELMNAWPDAALAELSAQRALVSLNAVPAATAAIADVVGRLDACHVMFSHLGLPGRFTRPPGLREARKALAPLLALAGHPHVAVKLSGLYAVSQPAHDFPHSAARPFVEVLLDAFTPARFLWGSDFSPALDFVSFEQTADSRWISACSSEEITDIMGTNLLRLVADIPLGA